jgi:hypothetical protein
MLKLILAGATSLFAIAGAVAPQGIALSNIGSPHPTITPTVSPSATATPPATPLATPTVSPTPSITPVETPTPQGDDPREKRPQPQPSPTIGPGF